MSEQEQLDLLKYRIMIEKSKLPLLCDSDYYNQCDLIEVMEEQLKILEQEDEENLESQV